MGGREVSVKEKVFKITHVTIVANVTEAIAKGFGDSGAHDKVFFRRRLREEVEAVVFKGGDNLRGNPMINNLKNSEVFTSFNNEVG